MKKHVQRSAKFAWELWGNLSLGAVILLIIIGFIGSVYGLRSNNLRMVELRNQVFLADQNNQDLEQPLQDLRSHVINHMNADLARDSVFSIAEEKPIQLVHEYYRDAITKYQQVLVGNKDNVAVLAKARQVCESDSSIGISQRLGCINEQVVKLGGENFPRLDPPSKDFYVFDFESPSWSPDLAGFSLVIFAVGIFLLTVRFIVGAVISRILAARR